MSARPLFRVLSAASTRVLTRAFLARFALCALLLFAQNEAIKDQLQHGIDAVAGKSSPASPLHDVCLKCVAFAGIDHAPASSTQKFALPESEPVLVAVEVLSRDDAAPRHAYQSRAPPTNS